MRLPRNRIFWYASYVLVRLLSALAGAIGWRVCYALARIAGWAIYRFDRRHRLSALANLEASFPHWPAARREQVALASMRSLAFMGVEMMLTGRAINPANWGTRIHLRDMGEPIRLMCQGGRGVIMVTCHFGNWEVIGHLAGAIGLPSTTVARRIDNPYLDRYVVRLRERGGQRILDKDGASQHAGSVLEQGGVLAILPDQDAGPRGAFVDFFGRPASTVKTVALMAMTYGCPICVVYSRRLDEDYHFEIGCRRVIRPEQWAGQSDPLRWITQEFTLAFEQVVRMDPGQYLWAHRRWKTPPGRLKRVPGRTGKWKRCPVEPHG